VKMSQGSFWANGIKAISIGERVVAEASHG